MLLLQCRPEATDLVIAQHAIALSLGGETFDPLTGIRLDPIALDREVEHLPNERERAIRHNRRAIGDLLEQLADLATGDLLRLHRTPSLHEGHVRTFARLLLVRRAMPNANVFTAAALLLRVPLDVLVRQLGERLGERLLDLGYRRVLPVVPVSLFI